MDKSDENKKQGDSGRNCKHAPINCLVCRCFPQKLDFASEIGLNWLIKSFHTANKYWERNSTVSPN